MLPTLTPGDVLILTAPPARLPDVGSLVVVEDPTRPGHRLVKRVASHGRATFSVSSDNPLEGRDSRHFGSLQPTQLVGQVRLVLPLGRWRPPRTAAGGAGPTRSPREGRSQRKG